MLTSWQLKQRRFAVDKNVIGTLIVGALVLLAFWGMYRSWNRRTKASATTCSTGSVEAQSGDDAATEFSVLYVATTPTDAPLQRLNLPGLGFRAKATIRVSADAISLLPKGENPTTITATSFLGVRSARVAIDRVVEKDGLTALDWVATNSTSGEHSLVTSYFRIANISLRESLESSLEAFSITHTATVKEVAS